MKIIHVKITKAGKSTYWYADRIGDEFYVTRELHNTFMYRVIKLGDYETDDGNIQIFTDSDYIDYDDCEVLEEFDGEVVTNIQTFIMRST